MHPLGTCIKGWWKRTQHQAASFGGSLVSSVAHSSAVSPPPYLSVPISSYLGVSPIQLAGTYFWEDTHWIAWFCHFSRKLGRLCSGRKATDTEKKKYIFPSCANGKSGTHMQEMLHITCRSFNFMGKQSWHGADIFHIIVGSSSHPSTIPSAPEVPHFGKFCSA